MTPAYTGRIIGTLEATFGALSEKDTLPDAVRSASRNAVADNFQDYLRDLRDCRDGSMLEELDELNVEVAYRRALESRRGLYADDAPVAAGSGVHSAGGLCGHLFL